MKKTYRTICISDVHLGTKDCKAEQLNNFLKNNSCETLYLIGDIIDAWKIQQNRWKWKQSHTNVIRRILGHAKRGTRVVYIAGNHDEFLRPLLQYNIAFGHVEIVNQTEHLGIDGKRYLLTHGDLFDGITRLAPWISFLGDRACLEHDADRQRELTLIEYSKIFKRKHTGKYFTPKWTIIR